MVPAGFSGAAGELARAGFAGSRQACPLPDGDALFQGGSVRQTETPGPVPTAVTF